MAIEMGGDDATPRLALPTLRAGQAQKEVGHNEALAMLDLAVQASVVATGVDAPPEAPEPGACWLVGATPTGAWAGRARQVAGWTGGGWRFLVPRDGWQVWSIADRQVARFSEGEWLLGEVRGRRVLIDGVPVVGARGAAIPDPTGGAVIDAEARGAVTAVLQTLRDHGLIAR